jgi:hypothetical protein
LPLLTLQATAIWSPGRCSFFQVMYESDYRHCDSEFPESLRKLKSIPGLSEDQKRHILGENAIKWFGFKPEDLSAG